MTPCLWFVDKAEAAAAFYVSVFPNSRILNVARNGGAVMMVSFELDGRPFTALNGRRTPGFTDAVSFMVDCPDQAEIDRIWDALTDGGAPGRCCWLTDRFGVSWQILPAALPTFMSGSDPAASGRAMAALMQMDKPDIAGLQAAYDGVA